MPLRRLTIALASLALTAGTVACSDDEERAAPPAGTGAEPAPDAGSDQDPVAAVEELERRLESGEITPEEFARRIGEVTRDIGRQGREQLDELEEQADPLQDALARLQGLIASGAPEEEIAAVERELRELQGNLEDELE